MSALNLIQEYSSESDEEIENFNKNTSNSIKKKKLPVPESILNWKGVTHHDEVIDDPSKHDGRIRSFKHERGNWATLVYIDFTPSEEMLSWMKNAAKELPVKGNLFEDFHISLTRTLILKYHWIDSFVEAVKNISEDIQSFKAELSCLKIYCNEEKTRTFIGITVQNVNNFFKRITHALDKLLGEYQLPTFYEDASHHISFLWCLDDQRETFQKILPSITSSFNTFLSENSEENYVQIDSLKCKIGNKLYNFNLK